MHIHTHYDNLQLPQNATDAEIRQAYRRLSKRYHPDLNSDPDAHRIMQLINRAYEVLSDPSSRAEHDRWILAQYRRQYEMVPQPISYYYSTESSVSSPARSTAATVSINRTKTLQMTVVIGLLAISLVMLLVVLWLGWSWKQDWEAQKAAIQTATTVQPVQINIGTQGNDDTEEMVATNPESESGEALVEYIRPATAPNGKTWPKESAYIEGYKIISGVGESIIYADNVRNSSDVFGQLYEKSNPDEPLRTFFLRERSELPLKNLDTGEYYIRYHQLDNGEVLDSESITITENDQQATIYLQRGKAPKVY